MQKLITVLLISFFLQFSATAQNDCTGNSANVNQFNAAFDISHLATGVYFVKIITNSGRATTEKLIVQRE